MVDLKNIHYFHIEMIRHLFHKSICFFVILCSIGSYFLSNFISRSSHSSTRDLYENDALTYGEKLTSIIKSSIERDSSVTTALSSLISSTDGEISISYFNNICIEYFSRNTVSNVVYVSRYSFSEMSDAEQDLNIIYDKNDSKVVPLGGSFIQDEDMWIVFFSYPFVESSLGFEISSEPLRGDTIKRMLSTGSPQITETISVPDNGDDAIASIQPVEVNGNIIGATASVFRYEPLIGKSVLEFINNHRKSKVCIYINGDIVYNLYESDIECNKALDTSLVWSVDSNLLNMSVVFSDYKYNKFSGIFIILFSSFIIILSFLSCVLIFIDREREYAESSRFKSKFISDLSHEIRTPMNGIMGMSQVLQDKGSGNDLNCISMIQSCGVTLMSIINDIVDMSKIEAGSLDLRSSETNMLKSIKKSVEDVWFSFKATSSLKSGVEMFLDIHGEKIPEMIICDDIRVQQVIINLVSNSIKFTDHGSIKVDVHIEGIPENKVMLHFSIKDTGIGMTPSSLKKAFSSFTSVHNRNTGGVGLGLTISKKLCKMMKCDLNCISAINKGTTCWFDMCLDQCDSTRTVRGLNIVYKENTLPHIERRNTTESKCEESCRPSILVVDDININRLVLCRILSSFDIDVESCTDGKFAVEKCKEKKYSAILMDMVMPDMNGIDATKNIRNLTESLNKNSCIIFVSANVASDAYVKCMDSGGNDYITKPVVKNVLMDKLREYMDPPESEWIRMRINKEVV